MIIRCDQCKTRFRLDDSKVTVSGVRVRCSKCKHTFVVRKDVDEEETAIEEASRDMENTSAETIERENSPVGGISEQAEAPQISGEINLPQESAPGGHDLFDTGASDETSSIEEDFLLFKNGKPADDPAGTDKETVEQKSSYQWSEEREMAPRHDLEDDDPRFTGKSETEQRETFSTDCEDFSMDAGEGHLRQEENFAEDLTHDSCQVLSRETDQDRVREDFPVDGIALPETQDSSKKDDFSPDDEWFIKAENHLTDETDHSVAIKDSERAGTIDKSQELSNVPESAFEPVAEDKATPFSFDAGEEKTVSSVRPGSGAEEDLPPLSITSRKKRSLSAARIFTIISAFVFLVLLAVVYLFRTDIEVMKIPSFTAIKNRITTGRWENGEIAIKNLDGNFVRTDHGPDIFVIRGEVVNLSDKTSSPVRIRGYVYGIKGEPLLNGLAGFGKVLSNEQLAALSAGDLEALAEKQPGSAPRDLIVSPGKRVSFQVIFRHVPAGAAEFGAEVVGSTAETP